VSAELKTGIRRSMFIDSRISSSNAKFKVPSQKIVPDCKVALISSGHIAERLCWMSPPETVFVLGEQEEIASSSLL
jgi:hypothetical protein